MKISERNGDKKTRLLIRAADLAICNALIHK